jgi:hypothetical protein
MNLNLLLDIVGNDGKIFTVFFVKKNGELRKMNCRMGVKRYLKGGEKKYKPKDHNLITVFDLEKMQYRSVKSTKVVAIHARGSKFSLID